MRPSGRIWLLAALLLVLTACGSGTSATAGGGPGLTPVTLTLNWYPYGEHAPFYYGQLTGIFAKHGIDLTIRPGQGSGKTVQAAGGNQTTFGWADTPSLLAGVAGGLPVKSVGVFLQNTPASVEFFTSENIHGPADLKGKTIATTAGDALTATFPTFLKAEGMTLNEVTLQNVDSAGKIAAVISGRADALLGFYHDQGPTVANKSGRPVSFLKFADYGLDYYSTGLITNDATINTNPTLVRDMVAATSEAFTQAEKNPAAAVAAMAGVSPQLPPEPVLTTSWHDTVGLLHTASTTNLPPGVDTDGDWQHTIDVFAKSGVLKNPGKPTDYWDPDLAPKG
ncbi:MAG TPA: ABC transporter substrate-binding protein [Pseudonocardiaceae bacterium]|jgi:NitT/TauT family transport system substrate-binding protein|nr:ABC transporter substrate-binding protein [Pseudonocardiaceae bacterium]